MLSRPTPAANWYTRSCHPAEAEAPGKVCMHKPATALEREAQATRLGPEDAEHLVLVTSSPGYNLFKHARNLGRSALS